MGLGFLRRLFGGGSDEASRPPKPKRKPFARKPTTVRGAHRAAPTNLPIPATCKPYAFPLFAPDSLKEPRACFLDGRVGEKHERQSRWNLPRLETPDNLAKLCGVPLKTLAWLCDYHRRNADEKIKKKQHYHYVWKQKKAGGWRLIEAPKPLLKHCQQRVLREILDRVPPHGAAHAFRAGRSIKTNAAAHAGKYAIVKADLSHFFPSIRFKRVVSVFRGLGYNVEISKWLARLCTNRLPPGLSIPGTNNTWALYSIVGNTSTLLGRHVPQGAPTSPALANLCAWAMDVRLSGLAKKFGAVYTRYSDDLTFSGSAELMGKRRINYFVRYVRGIVRNERFKWHPKKVRVVRRGSRQVVTGLTVNEKPNVGRAEFETLKAILHNCVKQGPASQNRSGHADFRAYLSGKLAFVKSVNPQKAARLERDFAKIKW